MSNTRKVTNTILKLMDEGVFDARVIAELCLNYMSEAEVADMAHVEGLVEYDEEEEDEVPAPLAYGPGTYVVHGTFDLPTTQQAGRRHKTTWTVIVNPDGSGEQYAHDGTHTYTYTAAEAPAEELKAWADHYGFQVEKVD